MTTTTLRRLAPFAAAVAVLAVLLGSAFLLRGSGGPGSDGSDGSPPLLHLSSSALDAAGRATSSSPVTRRGDFPEGPDEASVRGFDAPSEKAVDALAGALGVTAQGLHRGDGAVRSDGNGSLHVSTTAPGTWYFQRVGLGCAEPAPPSTSTSDDVADCTGPVEALPDIPGTRPTRVPPEPPDAPTKPPTEDRVRQLARPILEAAGLDPGEATVRASGHVTQVSVAPVHGELPTSGLTTVLVVASGGVVSGQGFIAGTRDGASYPIISADEAFEALARTPVPLPAIACPEQLTDDRAVPPCGVPKPLTVVGATFGLSMQYDGERPLLVPSWLFDVEGLDEPMAQVAVDPAYLAGPEPGPTASTDPGTGGGSVPGSPGTGTPVDPVDPTMPTAEPPTGARFTDAAIADDGRTLLVTFFGGVEECYDYAVTAEESAAVVSLTLVERTVPGDRACIELAQEHRRKVPLEEPLGDRRVVDAESGSTVTVRGRG